MDIKPPKSTHLLATRKIHDLNLKINQQFEVKIISTQKESHTLILQASRSNQLIHVKTNQPVISKQGEILQVLVTRLLPTLELELLKQLNAEQTTDQLDRKTIVLKQFFPTSEIQKQSDSIKPPSSTNPLIITAKIITIDADKIQLKIPGQQIITINKEQLIQPESNQRIAIQNFKVDQTIQLEVSSKSNNEPEFKLINTNSPKLAIGQHFSAKVIELKGSYVQLQLDPDNYLPKFPQNKTDHTPSVIILNKNQILPFPLQTSAKQIPTPALKTGQQIQFEVIKTGITPEFKLIDSQLIPSRVNQQVFDTIKQVLPIQLPPTELINQLVQNLSKINNNETISENLKRLAREIISTLPKLNDTKNSKQLKKAITNSGLFLETKLTQSTIEKKNDFQTDFKNKLLKFQHAIKQELEAKNNQKTQSNELNLLKEMQQKTEGSLARIILNQLTSLPKEEGAKQMWILDLPFINKGTAESVKIEINKEQQSNQDHKEENWSVTLAITPPELATIHCKISCLDKTINTRFWSDAEEVIAKITNHLDYLDTQFKAAGLETGHLSAHKAIDTQNSHQKITHQNLLDQKV